MIKYDPDGFRDAPPDDKGFTGFTAMRLPDGRERWCPDYGREARERLKRVE